ncbi:hypothetical protein GCM10007863_31670 [Dyella mobilis]|nr:hypothetical protein GCM10007863_31670 [Dyella mobilis]
MRGAFRQAIAAGSVIGASQAYIHALSCQRVDDALIVRSHDYLRCAGKQSPLSDANDHRHTGNAAQWFAR